MKAYSLPSLHHAYGDKVYIILQAQKLSFNNVDNQSSMHNELHKLVSSKQTSAWYFNLFVFGILQEYHNLRRF